jgi:hypothetical protein
MVGLGAAAVVGSIVLFRLITSRHQPHPTRGNMRERTAGARRRQRVRENQPRRLFYEGEMLFRGRGKVGAAHALEEVVVAFAKDTIGAEARCWLVWALLVLVVVRVDGAVGAVGRSKPNETRLQLRAAWFGQTDSCGHGSHRGLGVGGGR